MAAAMTVQQLRDYVRNFLDTDEEEIGDSLLDVWRNEATSRIQRTISPWSFYETSWSVTTSSQTVQFSSFDPEIDTVTSVEAPNWMLRYVPHHLAVARYAWGDPTGVPYEFSVARTETGGEQIFLWPSPSQSDTYTIRGYRVPNDVSAPADTLDMPAELHPLVGEWMLARAFEMQDDVFMSSQKMQSFERELDAYRRRYTRAMTPDVQAIGSGLPGMWPDRLRFPWE